MFPEFALNTLLSPLELLATIPSNAPLDSSAPHTMENAKLLLQPRLALPTLTALLMLDTWDALVTERVDKAVLSQLLSPHPSSLLTRASPSALLENAREFLKIQTLALLRTAKTKLTVLSMPTPPLLT